MPLQASAIIVAAGSSRRARFDKLMADLEGKSVLQHSVDAFAQCDEIKEIIVVTDAARFETLASPSRLSLIRVEGGAERHFSVASGLEVAQHSVVAVHDGARPLISPSSILSCLEAIQEYQAVALARRVTETVKRADSHDLITSSVERENLWLMETPQVFHSEILRGAYRKVLEAGTLVTDEVSAMELFGVPIKLISNPDPNLKITYPEDLHTAAVFL